MSIVQGVLVRFAAGFIGLLSFLFFFGYVTNQSSANLVIAIVLLIGAMLIGEFHKQRFAR